MASNAQPESLKLEAFSDLEFLNLLLDVADDDGWADSQEIADMPEMEFLKRVYAKPRAAVSTRLSWLWRYGVVDREHLADDHGNLRYIAGDRGRPKYGQRWRLTPLGEAFVRGSLTGRERSQLERMGKQHIVQMTRWLTEQARVAPGPAQHLMVREWRYGTHKTRMPR